MKKKLCYENNWEADEYSVDGKRVVRLEEVQIGQYLYRVTTRRMSVPYNDMGHTYNGVSDHFFVYEKVFGLQMPFDLNEIITRIPVFATKYEVAP